MDCLFVSPGTTKEQYQDLNDLYTAIEPPTWSLLLAESCRSIGHSVGILDLCAEKLSDIELRDRIVGINPKYICMVIYGQNPNSGSMLIGEAYNLARKIKSISDIPMIFVGSHVSALPYEVLQNEYVDVVLTNEGVYALRNILSGKYNTMSEIKGIGYKRNGIPVLTEPEIVVPQDRMDIDLPGYAWDLLPYGETPLDLYRSHFWHAEYNHKNRTPFAAIYTSLGCVFKCEFCMINILNRNDNDPVGVASNYCNMRFWSPELIIKEFDKLYNMGARTIRISDEMFLLNKRYYVPLCKLLIDRGYGKDLNMWAYSRIDTIKDKETLELVRAAGIKTLCLGIESGNKNIRTNVIKGKFEDVNIRDVIKQCHDSDVEIIGNYMFGLPGETYESMLQTLNTSLELCTIAWNAYHTMPLPGSKLYKDFLERGGTINNNNWGFFAKTPVALRTEALSEKEIIEFRDWAWYVYHSYPLFLKKVEDKFGIEQRKNVEEMSKIKLERELNYD